MSKVTKIDFIKDFAVFKNFTWDGSVREPSGKSVCFSDINILYGRNYSGKTSLSRIFRAFEIGYLSDRYRGATFQLSFEDGTKLTNNQISQRQNVRVFNSDFVVENLSFIHDENGKVEPFAILGEDNQKISQEINQLKDELGNNSDEQKTGLYKVLEEKENDRKSTDKELKDEDKKLTDSLIEKARRMKNDCRDFVSPSYDRNSLKKDIEKIQNTDFDLKKNDELEVLKNLLREEVKENISELRAQFIFQTLVNQTKELVERKFETASKIQELVENHLLNNWVSQGVSLHKERERCAFCGNIISDERRHSLQMHFDEEKEKFDNDSKRELLTISREIENAQNICERLTKDGFYSKFQSDAENAIARAKADISKYVVELEKLKEQIERKKEDVFHFCEFTKPENVLQDVDDSIAEYNELVRRSNSFGKNLQEEKDNAKLLLRLNLVAQFITDIGYFDRCANIESLRANVDTKEGELSQVRENIKQKEFELERKKSRLNDEQKGAEKVNEYLSNFFGHEFLKLKAIPHEGDGENGKRYYFEIQRNGEKAFNLSEGECRLVAFCYFVAKLSDIHTEGKKPLIWIDDPICSLDANHIFFIYSLISSEIVIGDNYEQLFISTHNLEFLKYLNNLNYEFIKKKGDKPKKEKRFFFLERKHEISVLSIMPEFIRKFITEFNYLFREIYTCSLSDISDSNYSSFYNFGNNARRFLEIYLFYKYPDNSGARAKQELFFEGKLPVFLNERITNEYSHNAGGVERASIPLEYPAAIMKKDAQLILDCIKKSDVAQYNALLRSIGVDGSTENSK